MNMIRFNVPPFTGNEMEYIKQAGGEPEDLRRRGIYREM